MLPAPELTACDPMSVMPTIDVGRVIGSSSSWPVTFWNKSFSPAGLKIWPMPMTVAFTWLPNSRKPWWIPSGIERSTDDSGATPRKP